MVKFSEPGTKGWKCGEGMGVVGSNPFFQLLMILPVQALPISAPFSSPKLFALAPLSISFYFVTFFGLGFEGRSGGRFAPKSVIDSTNQSPTQPIGW